MAITGKDLLEKSKKKKTNKTVSGEDLINRLKTYQSTDTSGVNQKYINTFMQDANTFLTTAEKDYGGVGWANASSSYEGRKSTWQDLNKRADTIGAWLYQNRKSIDSEAYNTLSTSLSEFRSGGSSILDSFKSAVDHYSQWQSEDEYNKWYEDYQKKQAMASSAEGQQGWDKYLADVEAQEQAKKKAEEEKSWWEKVLGYYSAGVTDTTLPTAYLATAVSDIRNDISYQRPQADWSDEQKRIFGYLYLTDPNEAYKYAISTNNQNKQAAEEEALKKIAESATSNFWAGAAHTLGAIATAPFGLADYLSDLVYAQAGRPNTPDGTVSPFEYSQAVTGGITDKLNEMSGTIDDDVWMLGGKGLGDLYGLGTSIAQSMASAYTMGSVGTLISYFGQGAASGVDEALSRGASEGQALLYGASLGVFEGLAEMIGVDKLFKLGSSTTVKGFIRNILKQAGAEGMEEGLTAFLSNIADNVIMGDKSNFSILVAQYMAEGMSEDEAQKKAWLTTTGGIVFDTLAGAASGGVSGGIHTSVNTIASNSNAKKLYGNGADLVTEALDIDGDNAYAQKMQAKLDKGKNLSGGQINRLVELNEQTLLKQDTAKMKSAVEARLKELGETGDIGEIADVVVKARLADAAKKGGINKIADAIMAEKYGKKLTSAESDTLVNSKGRRASTEMNPDVMKDHSSAWAENIGTERINADAYNKALYDLANETAGVEKKPIAITKQADPPAEAPAEEETATEPKFKVSEDGKARLGDTEVSIKEIASIKDGKMTLRLEDNSTVDALDVEFGSSEEGLLYENALHMGLNAATANVFVNDYDGNISVAEYALGFRQAYRYGEMGIPKSEMSFDDFAAGLTASQKDLAYNSGALDAKYKANSKQSEKKIASTRAIKADKNSKKKGKLHNTLKPTNETQRASLKALGAIADALGVDFYTFESNIGADGKRQGANGWYDPKDGSIHIDLYAGADGKGTMLFTAAHELTHHIRAKLPAKFKAFADFLFEQYGENGVSVSELIANKKAFLKEKGRITPEMTEQEAYDLAYEEVVADACETFLADGEAVARIAELKAKDKTLWQTIKDFITKLVARIKAAYKGLSPDSVEGGLVAEMLDTAEQLKQMWTEMVVEASEIVEIDANTESVSPMLSERTWTASEYVTEREKTAKAITKALNVDIETAYKYIDDINGVARLIADDRARLDYEPNLDEKATVLKPNSDYKYTVDMSTLCAKRPLFTGTFDAIQRALPNIVFDSEDIVALREMMQKRGYEVACGICYVESTRREIGRITQEFIDSYKEAQKTGKPITRVNSEGKVVDLKKTKEQKETTADKSTDKFFAEKDYTPTLADLNTTDIDLVKRDHPLVYEAYLNFMNARGQANPKLLETRAEYKGEILKHFKAKSAVTSRNNAGGLRLQSFSDFEVPHMIDMMQIVMDMARVGLKSQAYTKVPAFAEIFGDSGIKINLSLIAKSDGLDANGNLIFDDVEGINHKEAFALRDRYSKNVGTILVGKTDAHIIAAMADPRIDYIIPFHKSSWKESLYDALGLTGYADYTDTQNEKPLDKNRKIKNFDPSEYWDFTKSGDENAQIYLEKCREDGRIPKFPQFQGYPGYWKLLIDFKMYDNDGVGSPQEVVKPIFNTEASERILGEYKGGHKTFPVAKDVVEDFVREHKDGVKYSDRDSQGNELSEEQQAFFKDSKVRDKKGNLLVLYHGTTANFNTFKKGDVGFHFGTKGAARGRVGFGKNVTLKEVYLNITNPIVFDEDLGSWDADYRLTRELYDMGILTQAEAESVLFTDDKRFKRTTEASNKKLAFVLLEKGYDGIAYSNTFETKKPTTSYIVFNSNQAKETTNKMPTQSNDIRYSFRNSDSGTANDALSPYNAELTRFIEQRGDYIVDSFAKLEDVVKLAFDNPTLKATAYFGIINIETLEKIKNSTPNLPKATEVILFKEGKDYSVATTFDSIRHIVDDKSLNREDVIDYLDRFADTILEFDSVAFNYYVKGKDKIPGLLFKKRYSDGTLVSFDLVSNKKRSIALQTLYMDSADYQKKKSAETLLMQNAVSDTSKTQVGQTSVNSIPQNSDSVKREFSDRNYSSLSNRSLLANALESVAQNDIERNKLAEYKGKIALIEAEQTKLAELRSKIKELSFAKGERDMEALKKLQFEANQTANRINTYDRQLLNLESTKALKGVLEREKQMAYKRAEQRGREALKAQREKDRERNEKTQRELMERYQASRQKGIESRHKTEMRYKIKKVVNELNQYLLNGTKEKHVPIALQKPVAEALWAVDMDTVGADERIAKKREEMRAAAANGNADKVTKLAKEIEHIEEMGGNLDAKLSRLQTAYDSIIDSDDPLIANSHDDVISNTIAKVIEVVGDTPIRDMSLYQLEAVYDMYRMVLTTIRNTNKAFKAAKGEEISTIANGVMDDLAKQKAKPHYSTKAMQTLSAFDWNNMKPVYAFERIGSANFNKVFDAVRAGEDVWASDMREADAFRKEQFQKYKYDSWDFKKRYAFTSTSGMKFELSLDQILSLYAFSKRAQAGDHLKYGGFVYDGLTEVRVKNKAGLEVTYQLKDATAYNLSEETLAEIIGKLTPEQKAFADAMQDYLSTVMGEKGNKVSLALYDIKLFKEKHYFPLRSAPQYLARAKEQAQGEVKIKNKGFTKETTPKAKNPIVLSSFMDVWAGHVNEMSMYHAFTLPLEDFYRVYNYHTSADENMKMSSVSASLENAHGQAAVSYIDQLLKDLNGGAVSDPREGIFGAAVSGFKKSAVLGSLSVVVQQPTAIVRAMALVDAKHFVGKKQTKGKHKAKWEEIKKYAPVAVIKEMGYFDTGMGKGAVEWLKGEKTLKDKVDDFISKAPALADEVTWVAIWNAVKRETLHTRKHLQPNSEEFLKACGKRFTEVIVKTQVYDSTLARSANMRSKSLFMKILTAFMAEPTTSINMLQDAFRRGRNGKYRARVIGAVYGSVVLNAALVSLIYAMRDDDEDETYAEKYLSRFVTEVVDGINPLTYIPFVKDIWSAAQGFDVERADMTLFSSVFDSLQQVISVTGKDTSDMDEEELAEHHKAIAEAWLSVGDNLAALIGVPVKNFRREIDGVINTFKTFGRDQKTTAGSLADNIVEDLKDSVPVWGWFPNKSKGDKFYDAVKDGDTDYVERMKDYAEIEHFYTAAAEEDPIMAQAVKEVIISAKVADGKSLEEAEESFVNSVTSSVKKHYEDGDISYYDAKDILVSFCGKSAAEAEAKINYWDFQSEYPDYDLSQSAVENYSDYCESVGVSVDIYYQAWKHKNSLSGSVKEPMMRYINGLSLTSSQKDALYLALGWQESTLYKAPWH